jgi:hypothetical protein
MGSGSRQIGEIIMTDGPPPLKMEPKYGYYPRWPENGNAWVHPEDVEQARQLIPSERIFRRDGQTDDFVVLHYGEVRLRVRPALWIEVPGEGFEIGDWVEVLSRGMKNMPRTGIIREMLWDERAEGIKYQIQEAEQLVPDFFARGDLRHVEPTPDLPKAQEVRIEATDDDGGLEVE